MLNCYSLKTQYQKPQFLSTTSKEQLDQHTLNKMRAAEVLAKTLALLEGKECNSKIAKREVWELAKPTINT